jgi:hypothetical protein
MGLSKTSKNKAFFDDPLRRPQRYAEIRREKNSPLNYLVSTITLILSIM